MDFMTSRQWKINDVIERLNAGKLTLVEAAQVLGLSSRQLRRIRNKVEGGGQAALRHGNNGRRPKNRVADDVRERVLALFRGKYAGFNDQHFTEKLAVVEKVQVSRSTVQSWLRGAGLAAARRRRPPQHRRRRDRKAQAGMMILWDGSRHDWLEGRGPVLCLMGSIDDATGEMLSGAHFVEQECAAGYLTALRGVIVEKGVPGSIYMDRHGSLHRNDEKWTLEEELRGMQDPTQVGMALQELEIEPIFALSPQAKGRVERLWGTAQDRLVSELRLAGAVNVAQANVVLEAYRHQHNKRFTVDASNVEPAWRRLPTGVDVNLVCSFRYQATVGNDNTVRIGCQVIDIPAGPAGRSYAKARVDVRQMLDGSWRVLFKGTAIATSATTTVGELRALPRRKRSAASRAFRAAVKKVAG